MKSWCVAAISLLVIIKFVMAPSMGLYTTVIISSVCSIFSADVEDPRVLTSVGEGI